MKETLTIRTERVDDIPLLLTQIQRMGIASLRDAQKSSGMSAGLVSLPDSPEKVKKEAIPC